MKQFLINIWNAQKNAHMVLVERDDKIWWKEQTYKGWGYLDLIASQETPSANATVKRMARIAREAMK